CIQGARRNLERTRVRSGGADGGLDLSDLLFHHVFLSFFGTPDQPKARPIVQEKDSELGDQSAARFLDISCQKN
ncbi:hypothetical protein, partial [Bradyrhizobium oropedii]|uniref:hypothetical protein n=1 Tax=Bradyrhizobium oropedii TaxID=1571201 RepID=UPI001E2F23E1